MFCFYIFFWFFANLNSDWFFIFLHSIKNSVCCSDSWIWTGLSWFTSGTWWRVPVITAERWEQKFLVGLATPEIHRHSWLKKKKKSLLKNLKNRQMTNFEMKLSPQEDGLYSHTFKSLIVVAFYLILLEICVLFHNTYVSIDICTFFSYSCFFEGMFCFVFWFLFLEMCPFCVVQSGLQLTM